MSPSRPPRVAYRYRQREAARRRHRRRVTLLVVGAVAVVVVIALLVASLGGGSSPPAVPTGQAATDVARVVMSVPTNTSEAVGAGNAHGAPTKLTGAPLTQDGKPEILFVGAEYCPYCAAERWAIVVALSRFGTFDKLAFTRSSSTDVYPNTVTFTFHGASFTSQTIAFTSVETADRNGKALESLTNDQKTLWLALDPQQTIPFLDVGGVYLFKGATYDPSVLQGKSGKDIADALGDPNSPISKSVLGAANQLTAAICAATNGQPAAVCGSPAITTIRNQLG